jgi:hypothetical protein
MDKEKEKERIYGSLVNLTSGTPENRYFSRKRIMEQVKEDIEKEIKGEIQYRTAYKDELKEDRFGRPYNETKKINVDKILPKQKTLPTNLEELAKEGKVDEIQTEVGGFGCWVKYYRAKI